MAAQPNLYIVGFMGTGKSTVGRALADRLGLKFIDSDKYIEEHEGMSIRDMFESRGEPYFRELERRFIDEWHPKSGCVIACGGGLVIQDGMIDVLKEKGLLVCLFASAETILKRTQSNNARPLLNTENPLERIDKLMKEREPIYMKAGICLLTDHRSMSEVTSNLVRYYKKEASRFRVL